MSGKQKQYDLNASIFQEDAKMIITISTMHKGTHPRLVILLLRPLLHDFEEAHDPGRLGNDRGATVVTGNQVHSQHAVAVVYLGPHQLLQLLQLILHTVIQ